MPVSQSAAVTRLRCMTVPVAARVVSMAAVSFLPCFIDAMS